MDVRVLNIENLQAEYGVLTQRLLPWPALRAPFEGAWAVLEPGAVTTPHAHHEHELFIATQGTAIISADGDVRPFNAGDTAYLPPGERHQIVNVGDGEFRMYSVWWDPEMAARFSAEPARRLSTETSAGAR
ncbi:MAG TPA: cupin domain-containing protein [Jatrophihabitans sp.]|jgi:mannose-6-phosphate isomerase-like protein (cupin superfamily)|nr:cupin domain-containing protein [Jatrophihabitans sp.]